MAAVKVMSAPFLLLSLLVLVCKVSAQTPIARAEFSDNDGKQVSLKLRRNRVQMNCSIQHLPQTDTVKAVQWLRIDEDGSNGLPSEAVFLGAQNQSLVIDNFSPETDTGNYSCIISTSSGRSYTSNHLVLRSSALKVYVTEGPVEVLEYSRVELNCTVRSPPDLMYTTIWYRESVELETFQGYRPLVIENVTRADAALYACQVIASDGSQEDEKEFRLIIVDFPSFISVPSYRQWGRGTRLSLSCMVTSESTTSFLWQFNGEPVNPSLITTNGHSSSLMIDSLTYEDQGNYSCIASNLAGVAIQTNEVEVVGPPDIRSRGSVLVVVVSRTVVLDCQAVANPSITSIQWTKDGFVIPGVTGNGSPLSNKSLVLRNVTEGTNGNYSCRVTNDLGSDAINYDVRILDFPRPPSNFSHSILSQDNRSVLLTWTIPYVAPGQKLDGYHLKLWTDQNPQHSQMLDIPPNSSNKTLENLFPGEKYHAQLQSYNRAGTSAPQTTSFLLPVTAPKLDLSVTALPGGRSLAVQWTLVYDGGPDVQLFTFEVYVLDGFKVMVYAVSPSLDTGEHLITGLQPTTKYMVCVTIGNSVMATTLNEVVNTTAAPPGRPSSLDISSVTTRHIQLSFSVLEGSESISHFLLNSSTDDGVELNQKVIARDDQDQVESTTSVDGKLLHVELVVLELRPFTTYSFQVAAVSDVGVGEYSAATKPVQLEDGRIVYFMVVGVVGGAVVVVGAVLVTIGIMVWKSKASQKRKRTFSINGGVPNQPENSFILQSPPSGKERGVTPSSRVLSSPTISHDVPSLLVMDVSRHSMSRQQSCRTPSCEKLSTSRTRPDSLISDSYFSSSVGVFEKRPSVSHSESAVCHFVKPNTSNLPQSQLHSSTGRMPLSILYPRHQLLTDHVSSSGQNIYVQVSPQEQEQRPLGVAQAGHTPPITRAGHSPSLSQGGYSPQQIHALQTHGSHAPLMHQNSVQHHNAQLLSLPPCGALSSSAPMINVRLSRESILETAHPACMTDV